MKSNRTILQKADLALADLISDGGYLQPAQAKKFLIKAIRKAKLSKMVTVTTLDSPTELLENLRFANQVLWPKTEGQALPEAQRSKPNLGKQTWNAKPFVAEFRIPDEVLWRNIEKDGLKNTIMNQGSEAVGRDAEKVMIQGDTASADILLSQLDGIVKQASSHQVDASGQRLNKTILKEIFRALPKEYVDDSNEYEFFTSINAADDYSESLGNRIGDMADAFVVTNKKPEYKGKMVTDIPLFPETLGGGNDETVVIFTHPKNIYLGFEKRIKLATDQDITSGEFIIVVTLSFDARYAIEDSVVKGHTILND